jgi:hypothetical protein
MIAGTSIGQDYRNNPIERRTFGPTSAPPSDLSRTLSDFSRITRTSITPHYRNNPIERRTFDPLPDPLGIFNEVGDIVEPPHSGITKRPDLSRTLSREQRSVVRISK